MKKKRNLVVCGKINRCNCLVSIRGLFCMFIFFSLCPLWPVMYTFISSSVPVLWRGICSLRTNNSCIHQKVLARTLLNRLHYKLHFLRAVQSSGRCSSPSYNISTIIVEHHNMPNCNNVMRVDSYLKITQLSTMLHSTSVLYGLRGISLKPSWMIPHMISFTFRLLKSGVVYL